MYYIFILMFQLEVHMAQASGICQVGLKNDNKYLTLKKCCATIIPSFRDRSPLSDLKPSLKRLIK